MEPLLFIMRKISLCILSSFIFISCGSIKSVRQEDTASKELRVNFYNDTLFAVDILENNPDALSSALHIAAKQTKTLTKKIYAEDDISAFFYTRFYVPVGKRVVSIVNYKENRIESKNGLNQSIFITAEDALIKNSPYYIVLKNQANKEITVCNSSDNHPYISLNRTKSAAPKNMIEYSSKDRNFYHSHGQISMLILYNGNKVDFPISSLRAGYVYTYVFDGKQVVKEDERPLLAVNEPLWKVEDASFIIEKIAAAAGTDGGNVFYAAGRQKVTDANGNPYFCPALRGVDNAGAVRWTTRSTGISPEGSAYDVAVLDDGFVLAAGQRIQDGRFSGFAELYTSDGTLADGKIYSECAGFGAMTRLSAASCAAVGFDDAGMLLLATISVAKNALHYRRLPLHLPPNVAGSIASAIPVYSAASKTLFLFCNPYTEEGLPLPSVLYAVYEDGRAEEIPLNNKIRSVAAATQDNSGALYAGGESADTEKSEAVIIKVGAERSADVFYRGGAPFSYIAELHFNAQCRELTASGVCRAEEGSGLGGVPFIAGFDAQSGVQLWRRELSGSPYRLLKSFAPCADYGFAGAFASIVRNGPETDFGSSCAARLNATGQAAGL